MTEKPPFWKKSKSEPYEDATAKDLTYEESKNDLHSKLPKPPEGWVWKISTSHHEGKLWDIELQTENYSNRFYGIYKVYGVRFRKLPREAKKILRKYWEKERAVEKAVKYAGVYK